mgnify:CR=1 FL=1
MSLKVAFSIKKLRYSKLRKIARTIAFLTDNSGHRLDTTIVDMLTNTPQVYQSPKMMIAAIIQALVYNQNDMIGKVISNPAFRRTTDTEYQ